MPQWTGNYSRDMFPSSRRKQYVKSREQQGTEVADADGNDNTDLLYEKQRNFLEKFGGDSFFFDEAFEIIADGASNDVGVGSGSGFVKGHEAYLNPLLPNPVTGEVLGTSTGGADVLPATVNIPIFQVVVYAAGVPLTEFADYSVSRTTGVVTLVAGQTSPGDAITADYEWYDFTRYDSLGVSVEDKNLHSVSTGLVATVLTDTAMSWAVNELTGRILVPNITNGATFTILSNTATTITVAGDMTAAPASAGDNYLVKTSTPSGSSRTDTVWLNVYLDEIDATEDPYLNHSLGSGIEIDRRIKVRTIIMFEEGTAAYADYTDSDGLDHYLVKLATISRADGDPTITAPMVVDERTSFTAGQGGGGSVRVTAADTLPQELASKLSAGLGITLTVQNPGGVEQLEIAAPGAASDERVAATASDNGIYLFDAIEAGSGIVKSLSGVAPNQLVRLSSTGGGGGGSGGGTAWVEKYTATVGQTVFGPFTNPYTVGVNNLLVFINGDYVESSLYTETSTTSITLTGWATLLGGETVIILVPRGDGQIQVSSNDTTFGYLGQKLVGGAGITLLEQNDGGDESLLISAGGAGSQILDVVSAARHGFNLGTATMISYALPVECTAVRVNCSSIVTGNDWDTHGHALINYAANKCSWAWDYASVFGSSSQYSNALSIPAAFNSCFWQLVYPGAPGGTITVNGVTRYGYCSDRVTLEILG